MRTWAKYLLMFVVLGLIINVAVLNRQMLNIENELALRTGHLLGYLGYLNSGLEQINVDVVNNQKQMKTQAQLLNICINNQVELNSQIETTTNQLDGVKEGLSNQIQLVQNEVDKLQTPDSEMLKKVLPSVVRIETTVYVDIYDNDAFIRNDKLRCGGSGVVINSKGIILTCAHVLPSLDDISRNVEMNFPGAKITEVVNQAIFQDGSEFKIKHIVISDDTDVALVSIDCDKVLIPIPFADLDNVDVGDVVWVIGNPYVFNQYINKGIVSKIISDESIMLDADVNPGNSGGPVINKNGEIVGIAQAIISPYGISVGLNLAVSSKIIQDEVLPKLMLNLLNQEE